MQCGRTALDGRNTLSRVTSWPLLLFSRLAIACAIFGATAAGAITTTTQAFTYQGSSPGHAVAGPTIPPPTSITLLEGDVVVVQAVIRFTLPAGVIAPDPSGTMAFYDGAQLLGTAPLTWSSNVPLCNFAPCSYWTAAFQTGTLSVGVHTITTVYNGDGLYAPSTANPVTITIDPRPALPPSIATTAQAYTYQGSVPGSGIGYSTPVPPPASITLLEGDIAVVQAVIRFTLPAGVIAPDPSGTLAFYDGSQLLATVPLTWGSNLPLCSFPPCAFWQAAFQTGTLSVGVHTITTAYSGDGLYAPSTANPVTITIDPRPALPPSIATTAQAYTYQGSVPGSGIGYSTPVPPPASITLLEGDIAVVQAVIRFTLPAGVIAPDPSGTLAFYDGSQLLATVPLTWGSNLPLCSFPPCAFWQAAFQTGTLSVGVHTITTAYNGDGLYAPSTANAVTITINPRPQLQFSGYATTGSGLATLKISGGGPTCGIVRGEFVATQGGTGSPSVPPPVGLVFPTGLIGFVTGGCTPGSTVNFELLLPAPPPPGTTYWKFGATPGNRAPHWYSIPATVAGSSVFFSIVDGGLGDDDLTANGTIVDAGGPAIAIALAADPIPALSAQTLAAMMFAMMVIGFEALRRRGARSRRLHDKR
jgi:hypothetical protein